MAVTRSMRALVLTLSLLGALLVSLFAPFSPLSGALTPALAAGTVRYVNNTTGDNAADPTCTDPIVPCQTIQYAISVSQDGDGIQIENNGPYAETLLITPSVVISGAESFIPGSGPTVVDGGAAGSVAAIAAATATVGLYDLVLQNGSATLGGGIDNSIGGMVSLTDTTVQSNTADQGGGIYNGRTGTVTLAISNTSTLLPLAPMTGSNVLSNTATLTGGGGLYNLGTVTAFSGTNIVNNTSAMTDGGGLYNAGGVVALSGSAVVSNHADTYAANGGGLYSVGGTLTLEGSSVQSNTTSSAGGGLFSAASTTTTLTATAVLSNSAFDGGGLFNLGAMSVSGGAVSGNHVQDDDGTAGGIANVSGTVALRGGRVYSGNGTLALSNVPVEGNDAGYGGGIGNLGALIMSGGAVISNTAGFNSPGPVSPANAANADGIGGGIANISGTIGLAGGGNARVLTGTSTLTLSGVVIDGNAATAAGGGLFNLGLLRTSGGDVSGNQTFGLGGGLANAAPALLSGTPISGNVSGNGGDGGGIANLALPFAGGAIPTDNVVSTGTLTLRGAPVEYNTADGAGGGLYNSSGTVVLTDSSVSTNTATGDDGGGIYNDAGTLSVTGSPGGGAVVMNNHADSGEGGGLYVTAGSTTTVTRVTIVSNTAGSGALGGGGGIGSGLIAPGSTSIVLSDDRVIGNRDVGSSGGGIANAFALTVTNTLVQSNTASTQGGGISNEGGTVALTRTTVQSNTVDASSSNSNAYGGGIYNDNMLTLDRSAVLSNTATTSGDGHYGDGGGIYSSGALTLTDSSAVSGNVATADGAGAFSRGGGIANEGGTLALLASAVADNTARNLYAASACCYVAADGGGIYTTNTSGATSTLTDTTVTGNVALVPNYQFGGASGGGIDNDAGPLLLSGGAVSGNDAGGGTGPGAGGGIYNGGLLVVTGTAIQNNSAAYDGGGLDNLTQATLSHSTVSANTANTSFGTEYDGGGGIYNGGPLTALTVTASLVDDNIAFGSDPTDGGGGIDADGGMLVISASAIVSNTAEQLGGGLYSDSNQTTSVLSSTIGNNASIFGGGGGIANDSGTALTVRDSAIISNTAPISGGGIYNNATGANNAGSTVALTNTTVSGNRAIGVGSGNMVTGVGGGLYTNGPLTATAATIADNAAAQGGGLATSGILATLKQTILATNSAANTTTAGPDCLGDIASAGYTLLGSSAGCAHSTGTGDQTNTDPRLGPLQDNGGPTLTQALLPDSPAIDAVPPAACTELDGTPLHSDQRGFVRPYPPAPAGHCDIGAYEYQPIILSISPNTGPTTGGTVVTISGYDLEGATRVTFGGVAATSVMTSSSGHVLTATSPMTGGPGPVDVQAQVQAGRGSGTQVSALTPADVFTYTLAAPTSTPTTAPPTSTSTSTTSPPTSTSTPTTSPPTSTSTATSTVQATSTSTAQATSTRTAAPTSTSTVTPTSTGTVVVPTSTRTGTPVAPSATSTAVPSSVTPTSTPLPPTSTNTPVPPTSTAAPPTRTSTSTSTPSATATGTSVSVGVSVATATATSVPTATATATGVTGTGTPPHLTVRTYLAGGVETATEHAYLALLNPTGRRATVRLTFYFASGTVRTLTLVVAARTQQLRAVASLVALRGNFGLVVAANRAIAARLNLARPGKDGDTIPGSAGLNRTWYLAEGYTNLTFHETLALLNTSGRPLTVTLHLLPASGHHRRTVQRTVGPHRERLVSLNYIVNRKPTRGGEALSVVASAPEPFLVERTLVFGQHGYGLTTRDGSPLASKHWFLAEGSTVAPSQTFLTILNPGGQAATVTASFYGSGGHRLAQRTLTVAPRRRATLFVNHLLAGGRFASVVMSDRPIVVERPEYRGSPNGSNVTGSDVFGRTQLATRWAFPGADTAGATETLLVYNPNGQAVRLAITAYQNAGLPAVQRTVSVPAHARGTVNVHTLFPHLSASHGLVVRALANSHGVQPGVVVEQTIVGPLGRTLVSTQGIPTP